LNTLNIFGVNFNCFDYNTLIGRIRDAVETNYALPDGNRNPPLTVTYATANSLNQVYNDMELIATFNMFDVVHPDGVGIYNVLKNLYGAPTERERMTGSDFYPMLIKEAVLKKWKLFFFGDKDEILNNISIAEPNLLIAGVQNGYDNEDELLIKRINDSAADILIVGLGCPYQEMWIQRYKSRTKCKVIIAVGNGIKIFAGRRFRGPLFIRKLGLEWAVRFLFNPFKYFKRYIIGNPLFLYRVHAEKKKLK